MRTYIQINPADNVVVAVKNLQTGASLDINGRTIVVLQDIPAGHKVALQDFKEGDHIIKYGAPIGHAREVITTGSWVNEKNIKTNLEGLREYEFNPQPIPEQLPVGNSRHHASVGRSVTTGDTRHRSRCDRRIPS